MLQQLCNDASETVLIEKNGVTWKYCNPILEASGVIPLFSMTTELLVRVATFQPR